MKHMAFERLVSIVIGAYNCVGVNKYTIHIIWPNFVNIHRIEATNKSNQKCSSPGNRVKYMARI